MVNVERILKLNLFKNLFSIKYIIFKQLFQNLN